MIFVDISNKYKLTLFKNRYINTNTSFINTRNVRLLGPYLYLKYNIIQHDNIIIEKLRLYIVKSYKLYKLDTPYKPYKIVKRYFNYLLINLDNSKI